MKDAAIRKSGGVQAIALAGLAIASATPLAAQSVNDYRLPQGTPSAAPAARTVGPADPEATAAAPRASAAPVAAPAPSSSSSAAPAATPAARAAAPVAAVRQRRAAAPPAPSLAAPVAAPSPTASASVAPALPVPPGPTATPIAAPPLPAAPAATGAGWWPWLAALAGLVAAGFALLWWRQRGRAALPVVTFEPPVPAPEPAPAPAPLPTSDLVVTLEARRMSASLMAATLSYRLTLTNRGAQPLTALAVEGDMISAHASIPPEQQIAQGGQRLELRHGLVELAPGETAEFTGDFRLPLTAITPIRAGEAAFFVPLARFRVEAGKPGGAVEVVIQTYVIGELGVDPAAGLRPFRLDLGPRTYSQLGQRAVG